MQIHELLEAVEEHVGRTLHERGRRKLLKYLTPFFGSFQTLSIKKPFVGLLLHLLDGFAELVLSFDCPTP